MALLCRFARWASENEEVVRTAIAENGLALQYASQLLQKDADIVSTAVQSNGNAPGVRSGRIEER